MTEAATGSAGHHPFGARALKRRGVQFVERLRTSDVARRLAVGFGANLLGKVWLLAGQLIKIPVLTHYWGASGYGIWLMLYTIPTYVNLSDLGLGWASCVEMTSRLEKGDRSGALDVFQSVWVLISTVVGIIAVLATAYSAYLYEVAPVHAGPFAGQDLAIAIALVTLYSVITIQMNILDVVYQATHKYAVGRALRDSLVPIESVVLVVVVFLGGGLVASAGILLLVRAGGWLFYRAYIKRAEQWFCFGWQHASFATAKRLFHPSFAALSLTVSNALGLQGVILMLGWVVGPSIVAVFSAARMLTRIPLQFSGLVSRASMPELTRSQVGNRAQTTRKLHRLNTAWSMLVMAPAVPIFAVFGPILLLFVSHGKLEASHGLFLWLSLAATLNALWNAAAAPLLALNRQSVFSYWYALANVVVVLVPLIGIGGRELNVAIAMCLSEAAMCVLIFVLLRTNKPSSWPLPLEGAE